MAERVAINKAALTARPRRFILASVSDQRGQSTGNDLHHIPDSDLIVPRVNIAQYA